MNRNTAPHSVGAQLSHDRFDLDEVETALIRQKILVRYCHSFRGLGRRHLRIAIKSRSDNTKLVQLLGDLSSKQVSRVS